MDPNEFQMQVVSARATTRLVGREDQLAQIDRIVREAQGTWVLKVSGQGGIGKTRLVSEVLVRYQYSPGVLADREPVDLYHTSTHSIEGLMAAICAALDPGQAGFTAYVEAQDALDRYLVEPSGQAKKTAGASGECAKGVFGRPEQAGSRASAGPSIGHRGEAGL